MIIHSRQLPDSNLIQGTYCVIGAGAAGITIANELARNGEDVILLESGGRNTHRASQDLCKGEVLDTQRHGSLDQYRRRRFGGTTDVWGGRCAPFDPVDFEMRQHVPWSGWPINRQDLDPYYALAHVYCDLGDYTYQAHEALLDNAPVIGAAYLESGVLSDFIWRFSLPTDFGRAFWNSLSAASNVKVCLQATALQLRMNSAGESVDRVEAAAPGGKRFTVKAEYFVMATGGLETTRLLLLSRDTGTQGIGNARGLVGRFYISHITGDLGRVALIPDAAARMADYLRTKDLVYCRRAFSISGQKQRQEGLLNFRAIVSHPSPADPSHRSGVLSAMYLVKKYLADRIPPEYSKELSDMTPTQQFSAHCRNIVIDWRQVAGFTALWVKKRILSRRKLPSVVQKNNANVYTLHFDAEQAPNPESRVMLSDSTDEFGLNRLKVDWRCTQQDIDSVIRSTALVARALRESGVGKCEFDPERLGEYISRQTAVGSHHIGATRMADSPTAGVVDRNCKVHGVENLFIASSSVFPTSSFANPTLTIVALAIRLADHLKRKQSGKFTRHVRVGHKKLVVSPR